MIDLATIHIPGAALLAYASNEQNTFIFIKNNASIYQYANCQFSQLMGLGDSGRIYQQTDYDLCRNLTKAKLYRQHDLEVLESEQALAICDDIAPKKNSLLTQQLTGTLYPIYNAKSAPIGVMGVVCASYQPVRLTLETALCSSTDELARALVKRSYPVVIYNRPVMISKRELQCIIELLKGRHAGEIAGVLGLKQTTIECYIENIKDKLGATGKSSLLATILNEKLLQQVNL